MRDPYQTLGITREASEDEIKKAYLKLSRIYHPDANINNPNKEQAEEKFKEIQQAYELIMRQREQGTAGYGTYDGDYQRRSGYGNSGYSGQAYGGQGYGSNYGGFGGFEDFFSGFGFGGYQGQQRQSSAGTQQEAYLKAAANYINSGHYKEALNVLEQIQERSAVWYYYSSVANQRMGNNTVAMEHAGKAVSLEPDNYEYAQWKSRLESGNTWYAGRQSQYGGMPVETGSSFCMKLCLANLFCNLCCGGGFCCC